MKPKSILFSDYNVPPAGAPQRQACTAAALAAQRRVARSRGLGRQALIQLGHMDRWFWLGLAGAAALLLLLYNQAVTSLAPWEDASAMLLMLFSVAGPLLAALAAPVLSRSYANNMWELEEAAYHNLPRLTTLRLLITFVAALSVLAAMAILGFGQTGALLGVFSLATPFLLACATNYFILGRLRGTPGSLCCVGACLVLGILFALPHTLPELPALLAAHAGAVGWAGGLLLAVAGLLFALGARSLAHRAAAPMG